MKPTEMLPAGYPLLNPANSVNTRSE